MKWKYHSRVGMCARLCVVMCGGCGALNADGAMLTHRKAQAEEWH